MINRFVVLAIEIVLEPCGLHAIEPYSNHAVMRREPANNNDAVTRYTAGSAPSRLLEQLDSSQKSFTLAGTCCGKALAERFTHLPSGSINEFRRLWSGKMGLDKAKPSFKDKIRTDMKIVVGIMSFFAEDGIRKVIRETWMNQPGVCIAANGPKHDCAFYVVFVVGKRRTYETRLLTGERQKQPSDYSHPDIMHAPVDVPNIFKIKTFLHRVIDEFPWATHYGKMDTDTFPHVHSLLPRVPMPTRTCDVFFGATIPSHGCGLTAISEESENAQRKYACMHGSLYLFSRRILMGMVEKEGVVDDLFNGRHSDIGSEDLNFGIALTKYVRQSKTCLNITEAFLPDNPGGLWDHCGVNCKGIEGHGTFR